MKDPNSPRTSSEKSEAARTQSFPDETIRIILEGLKDKQNIAGLRRRKGISPDLYYNWSKEFLVAGKKRPKGDTRRQEIRSEALELRG